MKQLIYFKWHSKIKLVIFFQAPVSTYYENCSFTTDCDQTQLLECSFYNQTLYVCLCNSTFYWSDTSDMCLAKGLNTAACTDTEQCRNDLGLYCDTSSSPSTCVCNSTFYWTGTTCGIYSIIFSSLNFIINQEIFSSQNT